MALTLKIIILRLVAAILILNIANPVDSFPGTMPRTRCGISADQYTQNDTFHQNLNLVLSDLTSNSSTTLFYNSTTGSGANKAHALFYCRADIGIDECHDCVQITAIRIVDQCPLYKEAIIWYEQCTLWYANRLIFSQEEEDPWSAAYNVVNATNPDELSQAVFSTMGGLINDAAYNATLNGFSTGLANYESSKIVYCLVQCSPIIVGSPCRSCLTKALSRVRSGGPKAAFIYLPSCRIMYDFDPIFSISSYNNPSSSQGDNNKSYALFKIGLPTVVPISFVCGMSIGYYLRSRRLKRQRKDSGAQQK